MIHIMSIFFMMNRRHGGQRGIVDPIGFNTNPSRAIKGNTVSYSSHPSYAPCF
jgi:hypothetical protein